MKRVASELKKLGYVFGSDRQGFLPLISGEPLN